MKLEIAFASALEPVGYHVKFIQAKHLAALSDEMAAIWPVMSQELKDRYLPEPYDFSSVLNHPEIKSIVIVAAPSAISSVSFYHQGKVSEVIIPPICTDRYQILDHIKAISQRIFEEDGFHTYPVCLPKKPLAVHCGLAQYGRNNLIYVEGMGSFNRLTVFASDYPTETDTWLPLATMSSCKSCGLCRKNCPTGAILEDRYLLHAERCLALHNEKPYPLPEDIKKDNHHCLIGCIRCQTVCPHNQKYLSVKNVENFNEEETENILKSESIENLKPVIIDKIKAIGLENYLPVLSRNLRLLVMNN